MFVCLFFFLQPYDVMQRGKKKKTSDLGTDVNHIHLQVSVFFSQIPQMLVPSFMIQVYVSFTM